MSQSVVPRIQVLGLVRHPRHDVHRVLKRAVVGAISRIAFASLTRRHGEGLHPWSGIALGLAFWLAVGLPLTVWLSRHGVWWLEIQLTFTGSLVNLAIISSFLIFGRFLPTVFREDVIAQLGQLEKLPQAEAKRHRMVTAACIMTMHILGIVAVWIIVH